AEVKVPFVAVWLAAGVAAGLPVAAVGATPAVGGAPQAASSAPAPAPSAPASDCRRVERVINRDICGSSLRLAPVYTEMLASWGAIVVRFRVVFGLRLHGRNLEKRVRLVISYVSRAAAVRYSLVKVPRGVARRGRLWEAGPRPA